MSSHFTHSSYFGDSGIAHPVSRGLFVRDTPVADEWHGFRSCSFESLVDVSSGPARASQLRGGRTRARPRGRDTHRPSSLVREPFWACSFPKFGPGRARHSRLSPSSLPPFPPCPFPGGMARNAPASVPSFFRPGVRRSRDLPASSLPPSLPPSAAPRPAEILFLAYDCSLGPNLGLIVGCSVLHALVEARVGRPRVALLVRTLLYFNQTRAPTIRLRGQISLVPIGWTSRFVCVAPIGR